MAAGADAFWGFGGQRAEEELREVEMGEGVCGEDSGDVLGSLFEDGGRA